MSRIIGVACATLPRGAMNRYAPSSQLVKGFMKLTTGTAVTAGLDLKVYDHDDEVLQSL